MTSVCINLEKLPPPAFVTKIVPPKSRKVIVQKWSNLVVNNTYGVLQKTLNLEITYLSGYIDTKGTQLRLEKALMLTKQIQKLVLRWQSNDFWNQFTKYQNSVGDFDEATGYIKATINVIKKRLPSIEWTCWVLYLALRDTALLAKINTECERTIRFWFGLIASGHHWTDSLVICGVIARIWHLSGKLTECLANTIYPCVFETRTLLHNRDSPRWPNDTFEPPSDLFTWIQSCLKLPFVPLQSSEFNHSMKRIKQKKVNHFNTLARLFEYTEDCEAEESASEELEVSTDEQNIGIRVPDEDETEDLGIPLENPVQRGKKKSTGKKKTDNNGSRVKAKKNGNTVPTRDDPETQNSHNWRRVKTHWRKFFINVEMKLSSATGRRKLLTTIKKYLTAEEDLKLKVKLKKLRKCVRNCSDDTVSDVLPAFEKFQTFTVKHVKKLKKIVTQ